MIKDRFSFRGFILFSLPVLLGCTLTSTVVSPTLTSSDTPVPVAPAETQMPVVETVAAPATQVLKPESVQVLPDPAGYQWALVASGLNRPVGLAHAGDERLFLIEQNGRIRVLRDGQVQSEPFLDIQDRVNDRANEQGLLGLAFHPAYASNGWLYLNYTEASGGTVIARYEVSLDANLADPASEQILLRIEQPFGNHNGGGLAFGPDGYLYIGTGDGGSANDPLNNGQSVNSLLGKVLRLDVNQGLPYAIPLDNPFAGGGGRGEIWAFGLRNPWRFSFDPGTGDLYLGDVGQGRWEEINYQPANEGAGWNYGWNLREGAHPFATEDTQGLVDPVAEYPHDLGCSVTGGEVIRNPVLAEWEGVYLFGDYCTGFIWGLLRQEGSSWLQELLFKTGANISSFGRDAAGEVYFLDLGGRVFRLEETR